MIWRVPPVEHLLQPTLPDERVGLESFLDGQREDLLVTCCGLTGEQLTARSVPPSSLSLLGIARHLAKVERIWFRIRFAGLACDPLYSTQTHPDRDFDGGSADSAETDFATYCAEVDLARASVVGRSLGDTFVNPRTAETHNLRWVYLHMIEEYARHLGHADLLREAIDGVTG